MNIREQIATAITQAGRPLGVKEIYEACDDVETVAQVASNCYVLKTEGKLVANKSEDGTKYAIAAGGAACPQKSRCAARKTPSQGEIREAA